ncbi:phage tail tape measure protein [Paenibacillus senegalimassiliensis]|uniref:phage tail tape measure protein n=1 Tax=Paenibacillus senegalimassiliensis TaxID=1737426 RepID=UPI00073ECD85|nr:phage tail tape measure protein [Paenibacillus senegalimassiliensis]
MANENDIGGKVSLDITDFKANIADLNRQIKVIDSGFKAAAAGMDDWSKSEQGLQARIKSLNDITDLQRQKVSNLTAQYEKVAAEKGENSKAAQDLLVRINKETESLNKNESELKKTTSALDNFGQESSQVEKSTEGLTSKLDGLKAGLASAGKVAAGAAAAGIAAAGAAATAAVVGIVKFANDSAKAFNQLQASTGATNEEMQEFKDVASDVYSSNLGESMEDVATAMSEVRRTTGAAGEELKNLTSNGLLLRDTFGYEINESVRTSNTLMKQFGITGDQAMTLIAQGAQNGADKNGDLLDTLNEYSPQFKAMGYSADEFLNILIQGAQDGAWSIDKVGDAVKEFNIRIKDGSDSTYEAMNMLFAPDNIEEFAQALISGTTTSAEYMELLKHVSADTAETLVGYLKKGGKDAGDAFQALTGIMGEGNEIMSGISTGAMQGQEAMQRVIEKLAEIEDPIQRSTMGVALFGTQFEDLEASGIIALGNVQDHADMTADTLQRIQDVKFNDLGSALEGLKRQVLTGLKPVTDSATDMISGIVTGLRNGDWASVGTAVTEGVGTMVTQLTESLPDLAVVASSLIGGLVEALATAIPEALPGFLAVAVQLLQTIVGVLAENGPMLIDAAVNAVTTLVEGIITALPQLIDAATQLILTLVRSLINNLPKLIEAAVEIVLSLVDGILDLLPELIPAAIQLILTLATGIIDALPKLIEKVPEIIKTIIDVLVDNLPLLITAAVKIVAQLAMAIITNLPTIIKAAIEIIWALVKGILGAVPDLIAVVPKLFTELWNAFKESKWGQLGINLINGIIEGVKSAAKNLANSVVNAAKAALDGAKDFLGIHSPSRVMRDQVGKMIPAGMAEGIKDSAKQVNAAMDAMNRELVVSPVVKSDPKNSPSAGASGGSSVRNNFEGMISGNTFVIRKDEDIDRLSQKLGGYVADSIRGDGG